MISAAPVSIIVLGRSPNRKTPKAIRKMNRRHRVISIDTESDESDYESSESSRMQTDSSMDNSDANGRTYTKGHPIAKP